MADQNLVVRVIGDDRSYQQTLTRSTRATEQFQSRFTKLNQSLRGGIFGSGIGTRGALLFGSGAFIGSAAISSALTKSIQEASALNEELAKSREIFGDASQAVESWSTTTARALGISRTEALKATGTFGNLFRVVDLAPQQASEMSRALVQLAADIASFNNASPEDVLQAIRSGLIGEAEPLRRYGVLLSEARVQQEALAASGKKNVRTLTDQEKALARYNIILRDTAPAQGDVARTSDSLANQSRQLNANLSDLAGSIGTLLIPSLTGLTTAANEALSALQRLGDIDAAGTGGRLSLGDLAGYIGGWKTINFLIDQARGGARELKEETSSIRPDDLGGRRGPGGIAADQAARDAVETERQLKQAKDRFSELMKGLGLKLETAALSGLDSELSVLREMERAIERQIAREGRTFKLVEQLVSVRRDIADTLEARTSEQAERSRQAWQNTLDGISLRIDAAGRTAGLQDDLREFRRLEDAIQQRIRIEGQTTDLLRDLADARERQAEIQREIVERQRALRQESQFEALGLTSEGQERVPGAGALRGRVNTLSQQIQGTVLDTTKTQQQLERIRQVLSGKFGQVGRDVRAAILKMLNDISSALEGGQEQQGPLTKFAKRGVEDLIEGLGLSAEQAKELRQRFSQFGPGGTGPGKGIGAFGFNVPTSNFTTGAGAGVLEGVVFEIKIDGQPVEATVTRRQERRQSRTAPQRRGTRAGR